MVANESTSVGRRIDITGDEDVSNPVAEAETPLLLTIALAGRLLGLSSYQTKKLLDRDALPSVRIGERVYIPSKAVHEYVASIGAGDEQSA